MLDVRAIMKSLDTDDKALWLEHRTQMRRSFMTAHTTVLGIDKWDENDDAFLDLIDIRLALLFDRSGRMAQEIDKVLVQAQDGAKIENSIIEMSEASKSLNKYNNQANAATGWPSAATLKAN